MFRLKADVSELDGDGSREELIIMSKAMEQHMRVGFSMGLGPMKGNTMGG